MKIKKRTKKSRLRGRATAGYGARKKHKGKGHRGGIGMAGTGKRAGHKKSRIIKQDKNYFGKKGFKRPDKVVKIKQKIKSTNLQNIVDDLEKYSQRGIAKKISKGFEIDLQNYKILGKGELDKNLKLIIKCNSASKSACDKVKKSGGEVILREKKQKPVVKKQEKQTTEKKGKNKK